MSETLKPATLAEVMRTRERPTKTFDWPVPKGEAPFQAAFVLLSDEEIQEATVNASRYVKTTYKLDALELALASESALARQETERHLLAAALRCADNHGMPFTTPDELRKHLGPDTRDALLRIYNAFARERSPITTETDPAKLVALVRELKAAGALSDWLTCCDTDTLKSIVLAQAEASQTPTSESFSAT